MPLGFRIADEIERLVDKFEVETWIGRHLGQVGLLGPRACSLGVTILRSAAPRKDEAKGDLKASAPCIVDTPR